MSVIDVRLMHSEQMWNLTTKKNKIYIYAHVFSEV